MKRTARVLLLMFLLVFGQQVIAEQNETQDFTQFSGPGLDYSSWNGAMIVGPGHTLWGIRIGYIDNGKLITAEQIEPNVVRAGSYSPDRSFAELDLSLFIIKWGMTKKISAGGDNSAAGYDDCCRSLSRSKL